MVTVYARLLLKEAKATLVITSYIPCPSRAHTKRGPNMIPNTHEWENKMLSNA